MHNSAAQLDPAGESPLLSARFLLISILVIASLALASLAISAYGRLYGAQLALAGHSVSTETIDIAIGRDLVHLTANTIRFEGQRRRGVADSVDLMLHWPSMEGYSRARRLAFDDVSQAQSLLFLEISQSTMSRDMSGRLEPIYQHLISGPATPGPAGLTLHQFKPGTGFEGEVLLTGETTDGARYAVRCLIPTADKLASSSDCQRDIHVGADLSVLYRFSSRLLPDWNQIDTAVRTYVQGRSEAVHPGSAPKMPIKTSIDHSS